MVLNLNRCLWCDASFPPRAPRAPGRPRLYCDNNHRQRFFQDHRDRLREFRPGPRVEVAPLPPVARTDELIAVTLHEMKGNAAALARLSLTARRGFAWRCELLAAEIQHALADYFPGV